MNPAVETLVVVASLVPALWAVVLLERESALSVHTTGRSAALYLANYGLEQTRRLTWAARAFLDAPPDGFADAPLLSQRGMVFVGSAADSAALHELVTVGRLLDPSITMLDAGEVLRLCPVLRPELVAGGVLEPGSSDLDVAALHSGFTRQLRAFGGVVVRSAEVVGLTALDDGWRVTTAADSYDCGQVIDAAGAWGDEVARLAGVAPIGLRPLRRTAATVGLPAGVDARGWPAVNDARNRWYFKPEGDGLLISPADETPSVPCDARPDDLDVVLAMERVSEVTTLPLRSVRSTWAGLRTFSPDGDMVIGRDPLAPGFVWCVGQGGYGIQSAAAVGRLTADLVTGTAPTWALDVGIDLAALAPDRFERSLPSPPR